MLNHWQMLLMFFSLSSQRRTNRGSPYNSDALVLDTGLKISLYNISLINQSVW